MTSLERIRKFLQNKTRTLTLTAAPLAALVVLATPAKAIVVPLSFNTSGSCLVTASNATTAGSCGDNTLGVQSNGVNGLHLFTNGSGVTATATSTGGYSLTLDWTGGTNGASFNGNLPVNWDFFVSEPILSQIGPTSYSLDFFFNSQAIDRHEGGPFVPNLPPGTEITNSDTVNIPNVAVTNWEVVLTVTSMGGAGNNFTVNLPASININPAATSVPEPASLLLFTPGIGYMLLRRRKRA